MKPSKKLGTFLGNEAVRRTGGGGDPVVGGFNTKTGAAGPYAPGTPDVQFYTRSQASQVAPGHSQSLQGVGSSPQVQGASTTNNNANWQQQQTAQAAAAERARNDKIRGQIGGAFDDIMGGYDRSLNQIGRDRKSLTGQVGKQFDSRRQSYDNALESGNVTLDRSGEKVGTNRDMALSDLNQNIRNAFQAGNVRLGNIGAGDSSAAGQYSMALSKSQNQSAADMHQQANEQFGDIEHQRFLMEQDYDDKFQQLEAWKGDQITTIAREYQNKRVQLQNAKANAKGQRKLALAQMELDLANQARASLQQVDGQFGQLANQIQGFNGGDIKGPDFQVQSIRGANPNTGASMSGGGGQSFQPIATRGNDDERFA